MNHPEEGRTTGPGQGVGTAGGPCGPVSWPPGLRVPVCPVVDVWSSGDLSLLTCLPLSRLEAPGEQWRCWGECPGPGSEPSPLLWDRALDNKRVSQAEHTAQDQPLPGTVVIIIWTGTQVSYLQRSSGQPMGPALS